MAQGISGTPVAFVCVSDRDRALAFYRDILGLELRGFHGLRYEGLNQDELGIWTAPDGQSKVAFFADPDGNMLSVSQA